MVRLILGDCVEAMRGLEPDSVDAVVTDPPYGINFMGKAWDGKAIEGDARRWSEIGGPLGVGHGKNRAGGRRPGGAMIAGEYDQSAKGNRAFQQWTEDWAREAFRVLKPGGHMLVFGGTRTYHRMAAGIEDAGFEIRDCIAWLYGSGFPKSLNLDGDWQGWGTALKPAFEPVVVARKPLVGTVAANVQQHGTGALNVDGCRIATEDDLNGGAYSEGARKRADGWTTQRAGDENAMRNGEAGEFVAPAGRWPANVVLDEEAAEMLDAQTGILTSGPESDRGHRRNADAEAARNAYGGFQGQQVTGVLYGDSGGASRFFYCAKVSWAERNAGLDGFAEQAASVGNREAAGRDGTRPGNALPGGARDRVERGEPATRPRANIHPTVKPIALMRWLVRLVTPPGGVVLDPFLGSGTTGCAATLEGFDFIGCEREPDYMPIAEARIQFWAEHGEEGLAIVRAEEAAEAKRAEVRDAGQVDIFEVLAELGGDAA